MAALALSGVIQVWHIALSYSKVSTMVSYKDIINFQTQSNEWEAKPLAALYQALL